MTDSIPDPTAVEGRRLLQRMITLREHGDDEAAFEELRQTNDMLVIVAALSIAIGVIHHLTKLTFPVETMRHDFITGWLGNVEGIG